MDEHGGWWRYKVNCFDVFHNPRYSSVPRRYSPIIIFYNATALNCFQYCTDDVCGLPYYCPFNVRSPLVSPRFDNAARAKFPSSLFPFPSNHIRYLLTLSPPSQYIYAHNEVIAKFLSNRENEGLAFHIHAVEVLWEKYGREKFHQKGFDGEAYLWSRTVRCICQVFLNAKRYPYSFSTFNRL